MDTSTLHAILHVQIDLLLGEQRDAVNNHGNFVTFPLCKQKVFLINITSFVCYIPIHVHHLFS